MNVLTSEWTKLRTTPGTGWLLLGVVVTTAGASAFTAAVTTCPARGCALDPTRVGLAGVTLGQALVAILGVVVVGDEYASGTIRLTLAATPDRMRVLVAKAVLVVGASAAAGVTSVVMALLAARTLMPDNGLDPPDLNTEPVARAAVGSVLYLVLVALLSLGVATLARQSAAAIGAVLGLLYVLPIVTLAVPDPEWHKRAEQVAPMTAGLAIQATRGLDELPIGPWQGLGVLALWAAAALLAGAATLTGRDA